jgi:hypothetical protein
MCRCGKKLYPDKKAAVSAVNLQISLRHGRHHGAKALRVYACPIRKGWHMTSRVETD